MLLGAGGCFVATRPDMVAQAAMPIWNFLNNNGSAIIATCALGVTIWQCHQNHRHNKMSVRPKLTASEDYEDDDKGRTVTFKLINAGFGPAIIKDFILVYENKEISKNNRKVYEDFLRRITKNVDLQSIYSFIPDSSLLAGERYELFSFRHKHGQDVSFIDKLNLRVSYQSMYGDEDKTYIYDSKKDRLYQGREVRNA